LIGSFLSNDLAWLITSSMNLPSTSLYRTTDGGQTWEIFLLSDPPYNVEVFQFVDSDHGWMMVDHYCGAGSCFFMLYRTLDGGISWEKVVDNDSETDGELMTHGKNGLLFVDEKYGWMTRDFHTPGSYPITIEWTEDGGDVWALQPIPAPPGMPEPFTNAGDIQCGLGDPILFKEQHGLFAVHCIDFSASPGTFHDFVYISTNGLRSFQIYPYPGGKLQFINPNTGWSLGREIYRTQNGGRDWESMGGVTWDGQFDFVTQEVGFAVARSNDEIGFVRTFDGGRSWQLLEPVVVP
jgi:photosystem II stability/assembly factor-like uncharacterized protein